MNKRQAREWLDKNGHCATTLPRKGQAIIHCPPIYMIKAGIDKVWRLTALGGGQFTLAEECVE